MFKHFKEVNEKKELLINLGERANKNIEVCKARLEQLRENYETAKREVQLANLPDSGVDANIANFKFKVAQKSLAVGERNFDNAVNEGKRVLDQKKVFIKEIEEVNAKERSNLGNLSRLKELDFAENSSDYIDLIKSRIDEAEKVRIEILKSMGIDASDITGQGLVSEAYSETRAIKELEKIIVKGKDLSSLSSNSQVLIDDIVSGYKTKLLDSGVPEGFDLDNYLGEQKILMLKDLSDAVMDGSSEVEFSRISDLDSVANILKTRIANRQNVTRMFSSEDRSNNRLKIRDGLMTESDIIEIGQRVSGEYSDWHSRKNQMNDQFENDRDLFVHSHSIDSEKRKVMTNLLVTRKNLIDDTYASTPLVHSIISQQRNVGVIDESMLPTIDTFKENEQSSQCVENILNVQSNIPSEWVEQGRDIPIVVSYGQRGYYLRKDGKDEIVLSGNSKSSRGCAFHEMGHRISDLDPELKLLEKQFYERRTEGWDLVSLKSIIPAYKENEFTRVDHFLSPYIGKDYGGGNYEVISIGLESLFCDTLDLSKDKEYQDFMFGVLLSL